jgi:hypothetical protein
MRGVVSSRAILGLRILSCGFVLHLLTMVLNHTARSGAENSMMSRDMADHTANSCPLQASFGIPHGG